MLDLRSQPATAAILAILALGLLGCAAADARRESGDTTPVVQQGAPPAPLRASALLGTWHGARVEYEYHGRPIRLDPMPGRFIGDSLLWSFIRQAAGDSLVAQAQLMVEMTPGGRDYEYFISAPLLLVSRQFSIEDDSTVTVMGAPGMDAEMLSGLRFRLAPDSTFTIDGHGYRFVGRVTTDTLRITAILAQGAKVNRDGLVATFLRTRR